MLKLYHTLIIFLLFLGSGLYADEIKLGVVGSFNNFTPYSLVGVNPEDYYFLVYDSLMVENLDKIGEFQPLLAENYKIIGNKIIFNLNKKATWSNGEKITAYDVIYTFEVIKKFGIPYFKAKLMDVKSIKKINDYSVEFELSKYDENLFKLIVSLPIIYASSEADFIAPSLNIPITGGAYFVEKYKAGNLIVYKKNPHYWGADLPSRKGYFNFERIYYHYVKTPSQLDRLYKNGEITFKKKSPTDKLGLNDKIFLKRQTHIPTFKAYFLNTTRVLNDINLREAVVGAYNYQKIADYFLHENHARLQSLFENTDFKDSSFVFPNEASLKSPLSGEGVATVGRRGSGTNIKLKILFKSQEDYKISQDFINNLRQMGFNVDYRILPFYDYLAEVKANNYDIIMESLVFSYFPQDELISYFSVGGEYNYSHIANDKVELLIKKITSQKDTNALQQLDLTLKQAYIYIPLYYETAEEYIYKDWLDYNPKQAFSIYLWWHK
ncbi:MAG: ABC transporter substrate-binding protein [Alphaproteobacteria bacterium]|jgi:ABC-type oligopeptide transport system substrate-binding subunit|nr:ABC transporter substrate-binding protein [Alphaproteobacteria bacterium]